MANPTALVKESTTSFENPVRRWGLASTAQTYYPGEMIGANASGYATKLDDTAALLFIGVNAESVDKVVDSGGSNGDSTLDVKRPFLMSMAISSVAVGDLGQKVYAAYSNEVQFGDGSYGNYVGTVFGIISTTKALIAPPWSPFHGDGGSWKSALSAAAAATTTLTKYDVNKTVLVPNTAAVTITLPAVADCSPGDKLLFIKTTSDAYAFTLDGNASENINGATTLASSLTQYTSIEIVTDGSAWYANTVNHVSGDLTVADGFGVIVGGNSQQTISDGDGTTNLIPEVQVLGTAKADASMLLASFNTTNDATVAPSINFLKSGHGTIGSNTIVASGEILGEINFFGADGADFESPAARIHAAVDTTPGAGDMPGRLVFATSADAGETLTTAMTIDSAQKVTLSASFATGATAADHATIKGIYLSATVAVSVPSITDPDIAKVDVDVSAALTMQPTIGDAVIAIPQEALPTNARLQGAWVTTTDTIQVVYGSEGGNVTGAAKNHKFLIIDLT